MAGPYLGIDHPVCYFSQNFDKHYLNYSAIINKTVLLLLYLQILTFIWVLTLSPLLSLWNITHWLFYPVCTTIISAWCGGLYKINWEYHGWCHMPFTFHVEKWREQTFFVGGSVCHRSKLIHKAHEGIGSVTLVDQLVLRIIHTMLTAYWNIGNLVC